MRQLALLAVPVLVGCTTTEVVRIPPPTTLTAPHEVPRLYGDDNEAFLRLLEEMELEIKICNTHKRLIRDFYD
jgi:hypothetical protein